MSSLSAFSTFMLATPPVYFTDARSVINEGQKQTYVLSRFLTGEANSHLQGGQKIEDVIILSDVSTAVDYLPNDTFTYQMPQVGNKHTAEWRFTMDHGAWTDHEQELNEGLTIASQMSEYKRLQDLIYSRVTTSKLNAIENRLWASPHGETANMEASTGRKPYSIPAFLNENTYGIPGGWTTVEGINPTTEDGWRPTNILYDAGDPLDNDSTRNGLIDAFLKTQLETTFEAPQWEGAERYYQTKGDAKSKFIACSHDGVVLFTAACRALNDRLISVQNPAVPGINWNGIDIQPVKTLSTALLYPASGSTYSYELSSTTTKPGPRFYFIDARYLKVVVHKQHFLNRIMLPKNPAQPFLNVMLFDTRWNLFCRSRKRLALVSPGATSAS